MNSGLLDLHTPLMIQDHLIRDNGWKSLFYTYVRTYESTIARDTFLLFQGWRPTNRIPALKWKISQAQSSSIVSICTDPSDRPSMKSFLWLLELWRRGWRRTLSRLAKWKVRGLGLGRPQQLKKKQKLIQ